jgi:hypothetical protein
MPPHMRRALLGILPSAILTVILAHAPQKHALLSRAQPHTQTMGPDLGATVHQHTSARACGRGLSLGRRILLPRELVPTMRFTRSQDEMSADADAQPV